MSQVTDGSLLDNSAQTNHVYCEENLANWATGLRLATKKCLEYDRFPEIIFDQERYRWHPKVRRSDIAAAQLLYGTSYAQHAIWEHQHPADCSDAKFLTMLHWPVGMGALLHFLGRALGLAMQTGRILLLSNENFNPPRGTSGMPWYDARFCPGKVSWECWFEPLSGCREKGDSDVKVIQPEHLGFFRPGNFTRNYVPDHLLEMIRECSCVKRSLEFHWWHAQSITYILRFNKATRSRLDSMRSKLLCAQYQGSRRQLKLKELPTGTVAIHVRHGDKAREMHLLPLEQYLAQARRLADGDQSIRVLDPHFAEGDATFTYPHTMFATRTIFLSTENPDVLEEATQSLAADRPWQVFYTLENRTNADVATMRQQRGNGRATLDSFLNLELALEADAWVCTLMSNWCQLIDELRMTVGGKASAPYINMFHKGRRRGEKCPPFNRDCYILWR